jgi:endonuclease YncB( thermonuclease family)
MGPRRGCLFALTRLRRPVVRGDLPGSASVVALAPPPADADVQRIARITDGDTVVLENGQRVRLLQIDTPEVGGGECFSRAAKKRLARLLPVGVTVRLDADPALDARDRYGRLLRYVTRSGINVNLRMVAIGAAAPYFYRGDRGRWSDALLNAGKRAKRQRLGLWGACPRAKLDPNRAIDTGPGRPPPGPSTPPPSGGACDPNYTGACVPVVPYDLDCADIDGQVRVVGDDIHRFDGDGNGYGCEANR